MTKHKNKSSGDRLVKHVLLALLGLGLLLGVLMYGKDIVLFNPKGLIAQEQFHLMMFSTAVMLAVAVPTLGLLYLFAWKYRESNKKAKRHSSSRRPHGKFFALSLWVVPIITLLVLASAVLPATHKLDPHKTIASGAKPLTIQVIALRWKWLFIYPQAGIATVNFVQIPVSTPVQFNLTADASPMNSFWIPHLGGQLYAMTGHDNRLNLMADTPGNYAGQAAEINGPGFSDMKFTARVTSTEDFNRWVQAAQMSSKSLNSEEYKRLLVPSQNNPATLYSNVEANLYHSVLMKYEGSSGHHMEMP